MKTGTHNLGANAFSTLTLVTIAEGSVLIRQTGAGRMHNMTLSAEQAKMLKDVL
ncbi:hypothetical protein [Erythrobacter sp. WG]|uniref:hypothetical protein n=1 Tax=Erythrobacter sp. WG TaxID=2985510 RepID=UPI00226E4737|nr:hypothetical protein [Erythrobacter sp. WG]MCX9146608.1 hypothetical protein [Erythrobacter sp. WG]